MRHCDVRRPRPPLHRRPHIPRGRPWRAAHRPDPGPLPLLAAVVVLPGRLLLASSQGEQRRQAASGKAVAHFARSPPRVRELGAHSWRAMLCTADEDYAQGRVKVARLPFFASRSVSSAMAQHGGALLPGQPGPPNASWYSPTFELQCTPATCPLIAPEAWERLQGLLSAKQQLRTSESANRTSTRPFRSFAASVDVIGERESGTNFGLALVRANSPTAAFPDTSSWGGPGWKHEIGTGAAMCDELRGSNTLVIVMFRNALDWSRGFFNHPWHSKYHCALPTIYDFVVAEFGPGAGPAGSGEKCDAFEVDVEAYYWRKDGRYAANLMEARTWWAQSWLAAAGACPNLIVPVRYEELIHNQGEGFLDVFQRLNQRASASPPPAQALALSDDFPKMVSEYKGTGAVIDVSELYTSSAYVRHREGDTAALGDLGFDQRTVEAILERIDHGVEAKLGYDYSVG